VTTLTFLGTGTSTGVPVVCCECPTCTSLNEKNRRLRASVLINNSVVIDTGPDFRQQMLKNSVKSISAVIYTHHHADHILGLDDLRAFNFAQNRSIPLYADTKTSNTLKQVFFYAFQHIENELGASPPQVEIINITPYQPFVISGLEVLPLPILHGKNEILGYRIGKLAYLTDCSEIPARTMDYLKNLDLIVLSGLRFRPHSTHLTIQDAIKILEELNPKEAYLTHLSHEVSYEEGNNFIRTLTQKKFELAYDGLKLDC
jgi:phosphoribosyl 1,2-cyclic phosphate phosphodiesterase